MTDELLQFLSARVPITEEEVAWQGGSMRLRLAVYLTDELPSLGLVTSVRGVVLTKDGCVLLRNADGVHVLPGGRRQPHETIRETLCREILEETGCSVDLALPLGLLHFHHLTPRPSGYAYPYPDFVQAVFAVRGTASTFSGDPDHYEISREFVAPAELSRIDLPSYQRVLVDSALRLLC
jgi:8-oxo-dGTP pyrophosphatase MutT (NUDIX family)